MSRLEVGGVGKRYGDLRALRYVSLEVADRELETFSGGMRQRVGIAQALLDDPSC